ncbi:hypothetical protein O9H85_00950 [Paenibacillus filicis]|uniref:Uncharacterized protein n=1 Tax=Paenibacillus gyeongsangnamensis TaxID=3388067 RepID=A0ABT4Q2B5_9BACL|nr:hypothetical protein [Paenibacillus filicis]MCZ8511024.1 hypothetical protein [Paenibacillus filicis]
MLNLNELERIHADVEAVHEIVRILRARIDGKDVHIHILQNASGHYFFELSHAYRDADQAEPIVMAENRYDSIEEAARGALQSAALYYRSTDEGGAWHRNASFIQ